MVVVYLDSPADLEEVDRLLWSSSRAWSPAPLVAVSDQYDEELGLTLFQMGVSEYLGSRQHGQDLPKLFCSLTNSWRLAEGEWDAPKRMSIRSAPAS
jgi:hypothetical protein